MSAYSTLPEDLKIEVWRFKQFSQMGFSADQICLLKDAEVDTYMAKELIDSGCPPELAVEILT